MASIASLTASPPRDPRYASAEFRELQAMKVFIPGELDPAELCVVLRECPEELGRLNKKISSIFDGLIGIGEKPQSVIAYEKALENLKWIESFSSIPPEKYIKIFCGTSIITFVVGAIFMKITETDLFKSFTQN